MICERGFRNRAQPFAWTALSFGASRRCYVVSGTAEVFLSGLPPVRFLHSRIPFRVLGNRALGPTMSWPDVINRKWLGKFRRPERRHQNQRRKTAQRLKDKCLLSALLSPSIFLERSSCLASWHPSGRTP